MKRFPRGEVRIIGGRCRGRKIYFPAEEALRPTPNRVRETLFNWLAPYIEEAACLDMFAGSGALSFEAMSRGARYCLLLDSSSRISSALAKNKQTLGFANLDIIHARFPYSFSILDHKLFDIVFLDPPFYKGFVNQAIEWLLLSHALNEKALIYIESESKRDRILLPADWQFLKDKEAGMVRYSLIQAKVPEGDTTLE
jgi:16S rRNA (guanine966-N2)-methyltransferase